MAKERRKVRTGRVIGDKMDKTVVVAVSWSKRHRIYGKRLRRITKFYAHDGDNQYRLGDVVRIEETRPLSRMKRWRVIDLLDRREVADVKPIDLDEGILSEEAERVEEMDEADDELEEIEDKAEESDLMAVLEEEEEPDEMEEIEDDGAAEADIVVELEEDEESEVEEEAEGKETDEEAGKENRS